MNIIDLKNILPLANAPDNAKDFNAWIQQTEVCTFLEEEIKDEYIILYAACDHVFINSVLIPNTNYGEADIKDLLVWDHTPYLSWSLVSSLEDVWIEPPLSGTHSKILETGEQIIFGRRFEGVQSDTDYEINQKIIHLLDIYFVPERNAWCRLNQFGEIEDIIKVIKNFPGLSKKNGGVLICIQKNTLARYTGLTNTLLLRMFDFTRYRPGSLTGWINGKEKDFKGSNHVFAKLVVETGHGSYSRGIQLADIRMSKEEIKKEFWGHSKEEKQYAEYIAHDWKHKCVTKISCAPSCLANYFTESELPYELTPAFFRPEVLSKYKNDKEKYQLRDRSVSCRGAWYLEKFDVNEAAQVHAYLVYLNRLPYEEQLYWKSFNEAPKGTISARAIKIDFEGRFDMEYDSLSSLKSRLQKLDGGNVNWWKLRDNDAPNKIHYPYTNSKDEWADEILNLDQLLVEGFEEAWLKIKAVSLGRKLDVTFRSLKLLEECLLALNFEEEHAQKIVQPLRDIRNLRNKLKGHTEGEEAKKLKHQALKEFSTFRKHFEFLCKEADQSLEIIINAFKSF